MNTTVKFLSEKYGNYQDNYYTDNYATLLTTLLGKVLLTRQVNLGVTNGVIIENNFNGDFSNINCAIVEHDTQGTHLYKIIKKTFIKRDLWRITMVKDLVSSKYNDVIGSDVLVSRLGISRTTFDPILFQKETLDLSEVKKAHVQLSELPGVKSYGYLAIWARESLDGSTIKWKSTNRGASDYDIAVTTLANYAGYNKKTSRAWYNTAATVIYDSAIPTPKFLIYATVSLDYWNSPIKGSMLNPTGAVNYIVSNSVLGNIEDRLVTVLKNYYPPNTSEYGDTISDVGKIIYESSTGKYYEITRKEKRRTISRTYTSAEMTSILGTPSWSTDVADTIDFVEDYYYYDYTLLRTVPLIDHTLGNYANCIDQPFQMFYIPVVEGATVVHNSKTYYTDRFITESMLYDLIATYAGDNGKLLDVQVIPYSPVEGFREQFNPLTKTLTIGGDSLSDVIVSPDVNDNFILPVYEVRYASYSLTIPYVKEVTDYKLEQKRKYILTSPSGATSYEFSVAKNRGLEALFINVDLRPYSSFHFIQPQYKALYGGNYQDTRGLIWQEDTSLTIVTSAWETYKRQNVNYMATFNAEINYKRSQLSIDQEANWGNYGYDAGKRMVNAGIEATTFAMEAVAQDVWFGAKGGASGAIGAAAIIGGAAIGEAIEAKQLGYNNRMDTKKLENEIAYSREQFNYNIGNIKAIPENVEKVNGVFSTNNYVPYIQEFGPTEAEEVYFSKFLDLYGVNVGMLVDLSSKVFNYVQGVIVKYSGVITNEEYEELQLQLKRGVRKYEVS